MTISTKTRPVKTTKENSFPGSLPAATATPPDPDSSPPAFVFDDIIPLSLPLQKVEEEHRQESGTEARRLNNALRRADLCLKFTAAEVSPKDGHIHAWRYTCDLWTCPHCAETMRKGWLARLQKAKIRAIARFKPSDSWYNIQQRLHRLRLGVEYCRIWHNGYYYLFLSKRIEPRDLYPALKSQEPIDYVGVARRPRVVQEYLETALSLETSPLLGKHKVNTSRKFFPQGEKMARPPRTRSHDKPVRLQINMGLERLAELAEEEGGTVIWWNDHDITITGWSLPKEWFKEMSP